MQTQRKLPNWWRQACLSLLIPTLAYSCHSPLASSEESLEAVDYVDTKMGGISHLLVPTYPTVHLPNSLMRVHPQRSDYASEQISGLPLILTSHRGVSAFSLSPRTDITDSIPITTRYSYDEEVIRPYSYDVFLVEPEVKVSYAPSAQSAIYTFTFENDSKGHYLVFSTAKGQLQAFGRTLRGYQELEDSTRVYLYAESDVTPEG